jgi:tight adherence protein C
MGTAVPDLVELLVATTDAGLSPAVALRRSSEMLRGPLGEELRRAVSEVEFGLPWQRALERMVVRSEVPSLRALAAALSRSQQLGTVLGSTLRRVAEDLRRERRARAEEAARKAPIKMLFPLVFLILPAFLLLTVGPVVLATIRSLH